MSVVPEQVQYLLGIEYGVRSWGCEKGGARKDCRGSMVEEEGRKGSRRVVWPLGIGVARLGLCFSGRSRRRGIFALRSSTWATCNAAHDLVLEQRIG